jgi:prolyl oligopeptidase
MRASRFAVLCAAVLAILILSPIMTFASESAATANAIPPTDFPKPPKTTEKPVEETIHGVKVVDPYRYLENSSAPETQQFVQEQLSYTRSVLDRLPGRDKIHGRLSELLAIGNITTPEIGGKYYFYTRREGMQNQAVLYVREGLHGQDRVLVDVNKAAADGTVALDWWYPTHDGRYVAYGTSPSGSELSTLRIIETATGKLLADEISQTRAASIAWLPDDSAFYYTRYPKKGDVPAGEELYNRKVFFHKVGGDATKDPLVFGEGLERTYWPNLTISEDGRWLAIQVEEGWTKTELWLKDTKSTQPAIPIAKDKEALYNALTFKNTMYILTNEDAPRFRIFATPVDKPQRANWKEIVPQSDAVIKDIDIVDGKLACEFEHNASSQFRVYDLNGKLLANVSLPTIGSILGIGGQYDSKEAFFGFQSYTVPPTIYRVDMGNVSQATKPEQWAQVKAPIDTSKYDVKQVWYNSKDGTRVPMFVVAGKGVELNGHNPTLLTGYGGFNVSNTPAFSRGVYVWLDHGGVYAVANLRGGAEFGEDWHKAGMLDKKQNVFDDFYAAAEYLVAQKYTDRDHLAIQGGSNGGLLMGAAMTQRPDLFRAVICQVPLLDMLRYQNFQIAKLWVPEYGSAEDPEQFKFIYAYSPYQHVEQGTKYPAVLFMTADTDTRVDPMHAKKMAARMQAANGGDRPILLRIETKAGHGAGKPVTKQIEEQTDIYSFLFWQLGVQP